MSQTFLTAEWRKLIMAQYEVDPALLRKYLPAGVELDLFQEHCFVSLVGFLFTRVRVKGVAFPLHTEFEEINLRFYVRRRDSDGMIRRGVVFVREFVPRAAIAFVAKHFYEEPYAYLPTRHTIEATCSGQTVSFAWKKARRWHNLSVQAATESHAIAHGSVEEFITEHYWGFTRRSNGSTSQYQVQHPRWKVYPVQSCSVDADMRALYGDEFAFLNQQPVANVLLAEGSAVKVLGGTRLD